MRTFRIIQGIAASVGMLMAVSLADGMGCDRKRDRCQCGATCTVRCHTVRGVNE